MIKHREVVSIVLAVKICYIYRMGWQEMEAKKKNEKTKKRKKNKNCQKKIEIWNKIFCGIISSSTFTNKIWLSFRDRNDTKKIINGLIKDIENNFFSELKDIGYIPKEVKSTPSFKSNLFSLLICYATRTPILIWGEMKSEGRVLSQIFCNAMRGHFSKKSEYLSSFEALKIKGFSEIYYKGSKKSTEQDVQNIFLEAETEIEKSGGRIQPLIIIDNIELADKSPHQPLRILNSYFDNKRRGYSFLAISRGRDGFFASSRMNYVFDYEETDIKQNNLEMYSEFVNKEIDMMIELRMNEFFETNHDDEQDKIIDFYSFVKLTDNLKYLKIPDDVEGFREKVKILKERIEEKFGGEIYKDQDSDTIVVKFKSGSEFDFKDSSKYLKYSYLLKNLKSSYFLKGSQYFDGYGEFYSEQSSQKSKSVSFNNSKDLSNTNSDEEKKEDLNSFIYEILEREKISENKEILKNIKEGLKSKSEKDLEIIEEKILGILNFSKKDDEEEDTSIQPDKTEGSEKMNKYKVENYQFILDLIKEKRNIQKLKNNEEGIYYEEFELPYGNKEEMGENGDERRNDLQKELKVFEAARKKLRTLISDISNEEEIKILDELRTYFRELVNPLEICVERNVLDGKKLCDSVCIEESYEFEWVKEIHQNFFKKVSGKFFKLLIVELENLMSKIQDKI